MAGLPEAEIEAQQKQHIRHTRCVAFVVLGIVVVMSLSMGIIWAVVRPKRPIVVIEMGYIKNVTTISPTSLETHLEFVMRFYNPNKKVTAYYDSMELFNRFSTGKISVGHLNASFSLPPFDVTRLICPFRVAFRPMFANINMARYINNGKFGVQISMKGKIRFGVGKWKSMPQTVWIYCQTRAVRVRKSYDTTSCYVDL